MTESESFDLECSQSIQALLDAATQRERARCAKIARSHREWGEDYCQTGCGAEEEIAAKIESGE